MSSTEAENEITTSSAFILPICTVSRDDVDDAYPNTIFVAFSKTMLPLSCTVAELRGGQASPGHISGTHSATNSSSSDSAIIW
jgi:hypothetical protein